MKKIYSFLMLAVMALVMSFTAKAASVTIDVDDPSRVSVQVNGVEKTLVAGDNTFELTVGNYTSISISAKEGALLKSITNESGTPQDSYTTLYPTQEDAAYKYIVKTLSIAEARTASCTINVDKAYNIGGLQMSSTNERVTLVDGENTVKFIPDMESPFVLSAPYGKTFYRVTVDSVDVAESYNGWNLNVRDGSVVDIQTEFPDVEVAVNIAFASEESKGALRGIMVDDEEVTPDANGNINVKLGKTVTVFLDNSNYAVESVTVNGEEQDFYGDEFSFVVTEATNLVINAHKYGTLKATISVEHPECVVVKDGNGNVLNLVAGDNEIEVSENSADISVTKAAGCRITSILVNGAEYSNYGYDSSYGTRINIPSDGTTIVIVAEEIIYDNTVIINIDDECYSYSYMMNYSNRDQVYLVKGENKYKFNNGENSHRLYIMTTSNTKPAAIYLNGVCLDVPNTQDVMFEGDLALKNGDVIDVYMYEDPATGIDEVGAEAGEVEYYNLQGVKVANPENGIFIKKQGSKTTKVVL